VHDNCLVASDYRSQQQVRLRQSQRTYTVAIVAIRTPRLCSRRKRVAKAHGWKLIPYLKINCPFLDLKTAGSAHRPRCTRVRFVNSVVLSRLQKTPPDLCSSRTAVITLADAGQETVTAESNALVRMILKIPSTTKS